MEKETMNEKLRTWVKRKLSERQLTKLCKDHELPWSTLAMFGNGNTGSISLELAERVIPLMQREEGE